MRAVWSFWTKPYVMRTGNRWLSDRHHLQAWVLSLETARSHYPETVLVTDDEGAELLVKRLRLAFTEVSTALNALANEDPMWWALGKLWTYRLQREPFIHIDNDVFLWNRLPLELEQAPVLAQNPESFSLVPESCYRSTRFTQALHELKGWIPEEWRRASEERSTRAICCGIFGGNAIGFLQYYADLAIRMIQHPSNRPVWRQTGAGAGDGILFEQYLLAACLEYHQRAESSPYAAVSARYLFDSMAESFDEVAAARAGYTHLIGGAKRNKKLMRSLENRVMRDYPEQYERCCRLDAGTARAAAQR